MLATGDNVIFIPLGIRFHFGSLTQVGRDPLSGFIDDSPFSICCQQLGPFALMKLIADTSQVSSTLIDICLIANREAPVIHPTSELNSRVAAVASNSKLKFEFEICDITSLPDQKLVGGAWVIGGRFGGDCGILYGPIAHVQPLPAGKCFSIKE